MLYVIFGMTLSHARVKYLINSRPEDQSKLQN